MCQHIMKIAIAVAFGLVFNGVAYSQTSGWYVRSTYSNADGTVQYIGLGGDTESVLAGQTLIASDGKTEHRFSFPSNVGLTSEIGRASCRERV